MLFNLIAYVYIRTYVDMYACMGINVTLSYLRSEVVYMLHTYVYDVALLGVLRLSNGMCYNFSLNYIINSDPHCNVTVIYWA